MYTDGLDEPIVTVALIADQHPGPCRGQIEPGFVRPVGQHEVEAIPRSDWHGKKRETRPGALRSESGFPRRRRFGYH